MDLMLAKNNEKKKQNSESKTLQNHFKQQPISLFVGLRIKERCNTFITKEILSPAGPHLTIQYGSDFAMRS